MMIGVDRTNNRVFLCVFFFMRGVFVPPSKLIVTNCLFPPNVVFIRGLLFRGGGDY